MIVSNNQSTGVTSLILSKQSLKSVSYKWSYMSQYIKLRGLDKKRRNEADARDRNLYVLQSVASS